MPSRDNHGTGYTSAGVNPSRDEHGTGYTSAGVNPSRDKHGTGYTSAGLRLGLRGTIVVVIAAHIPGNKK
jgi:hypothetical protein